jgi:hypothetical protein
MNNVVAWLAMSAVCQHWRTRPDAARNPDDPAKISVPEALPGDGRDASGCPRSRSHPGGIRSCQHQPHRIFAEQVPRMGQLAKIEALQRETFLLIRAYLEERRDEISVRDLDSATFICVTTAEALTHEYVINKPDALADDRERFIDEVARLLMDYLTPGSTPRAGPRRPAAGRARSA